MDSDDEVDNLNSAQLRELLGGDDSSNNNNNEEAIVFSEDEEEEEEEEEENGVKVKQKEVDLHDMDDVDEDDGEESDEPMAAIDTIDDPSDEDYVEEEEDEGFEYSDEEDEQLGESDIDEEFEFHNALREASNFRVKKKKKGRKGAKKPKRKKGGLAALRRKIRREEVDPEIAMMLGKANEAFVRNDMDTARRLLKDVIKKDKNNFSAYKTLGEIQRIQGNSNNCSNLWLLAAHIRAWDWQFWGELAQLSEELGHQRQAVYCYTKAVRASHHTDLGSIFSRACLYREQSRYKRATDGLLFLRKSVPTDATVVQELAKVYRDENRVNDAITMYSKILEDNVAWRRSGKDDKVDPLTGEKAEFKNVRFSWSELNILSELYGGKGAWQLGIRALRQTSRWIQHRENQEFWDDHPDTDVEFDERRFDYPKFQNLPLGEKKKDYALPIDIRAQLGIFRLRSKGDAEALKQFGFLLEEPIENTSDLFLKVGVELETFGFYKEALEFLLPLSYLEEQNTAELAMSIAKCLRETNEFESAKEAYVRLLEYNPDDVEIKVALAEVCFYLNDMETTSRLYKEARQQRLSERKGAEAEGEADKDESEEPDEQEDFFDQTHQALIADLPTKKSKKKKIEVSAGEMRTMEEQSERRIQKQYSRAVALLGRLGSTQGEARNAMAALWIDLVSDLIETFSMYRCFFSSERARRFNVGIRKRISKLNVDHKLSRMRHLQNEMILSREMDDPDKAKRQTAFKGIAYADWYDLFMKYTLMIAQYEHDVDSSMNILEVAKNVNVFSKNGLTSALVGISIALLSGDDPLVHGEMRSLMNQYQFSPVVMKLFLAAYIPDSYNVDHFGDASTQKYILRQVKAYDSLKEHKDVSGMAAVTNKNVDLTKNHPLLNYIYATFLYMNKSYYSALAYCLKLYPDFKKDSSLIFLLALCNIHRSTQRKTLNTNFQILQGLTFLREYVQLMDMSDPYQQMEVFYNIGRTFNQLGLDSIAVSFYEKVLAIEVDDERYDLKREAAFNLYMIYNVNQNHRLAEDIMDRYLVV